jgi:hypothetical protein
MARARAASRNRAPKPRKSPAIREKYNRTDFRKTHLAALSYGSHLSVVFSVFAVLLFA